MIHDRGTGTGICVGLRVQFISLSLGQDDVKFSPPEEKVCKGVCVRYFPIFLPSKNGVYTKAPIDETRNEPYNAFKIETLEVIMVYMGEQLDTNHDICVLLLMFYLSVD